MKTNKIDSSDEEVIRLLKLTKDRQKKNIKLKRIQISNKIVQKQKKMTFFEIYIQISFFIQKLFLSLQRNLKTKQYFNNI